MIAKPIVEQILQNIELCRDLYYQLLLIVAPAGAGKTKALKELQALTGAPLINVNLELSRRMLDLTERQRALQVPRLLENIANQNAGSLILLDNIEMLFDINLKQDPLRLLQGLSRSRTVISSWNSVVEENHIIYAESGHPEYRKYLINDFIVVGI
jgi:ABC-type hemin transport system ATPase subunit